MWGMKTWWAYSSNVSAAPGFNIWTIAAPSMTTLVTLGASYCASERPSRHSACHSWYQDWVSLLQKVMEDTLDSCVGKNRHRTQSSHVGFSWLVRCRCFPSVHNFELLRGCHFASALIRPSTMCSLASICLYSMHKHPHEQGRVLTSITSMSVHLLFLFFVCFFVCCSG